MEIDDELHESNDRMKPISSSKKGNFSTKKLPKNKGCNYLLEALGI